MAMLTTPTRPIQQEYQTYQNLTDKQAQHFIATYAIPRRSLKNFGAEHGVISSAQTPTTTEVIFEIIIPSSKDIENFPMSIHREFSPSIVVAEEGSEDKILQNKKHDSKLVRKTRKKIQVNPETEPEGHSAVIKIKRKYPFETESNKKLSIRSILESDMKSEMAASEHIESFYLPPPGTSNKSQISAAKLPSEIDFEAPAPPDRNISSKLESPPHVVVTFDGKRVSGASLTAKPFEKSILGRGSKAAELLKTQPQSIPFQGDLPPLNPNVLFHSAGLQPGVLSRNLDTPLPTKLKRLRRGGTGPFMSK